MTDALRDNGNPTILIRGCLECSENNPTRYDVTVTNPNICSDLEGKIFWGDLNADIFAFERGVETQTLSFTHPFVDDNPTGTPQDPYIITAQICDDDGRCGQDRMTVTVRNEPPVVSIESIVQELGIELDTDVNFLLPFIYFTMNVKVVDVGRHDLHDCEVSWGDGSQGDAPAPQVIDDVTSKTAVYEMKHQYETPTGYSIEYRATDDDTGNGVDSKTVQVYDDTAGINAAEGMLDAMDLPDDDWKKDPIKYLEKAAYYLNKSKPSSLRRLEDEDDIALGHSEQQSYVASALKKLRNAVKKMAYYDLSFKSYDPIVPVLLLVVKSITLTLLKTYESSMYFFQPDFDEEKMAMEADVSREVDPLEAMDTYYEAARTVT